MNTFELLDELSKKSKEEIQYCLLSLMINDKIDFNDVNKSYVNYLRTKDKENVDKISEKNFTICGLLSHFEEETTENSADIHRALYNLNESNQFQMQRLNEKFKYNEETDKQLSWYWRNHKTK